MYWYYAFNAKSPPHKTQTNSEPKYVFIVFFEKSVAKIYIYKQHIISIQNEKLSNRKTIIKFIVKNKSL